MSHGTGTIHSAALGDITVHCATPAPPSGLDRTFGSDGRVSTPVGAGQGEAVLVQPDGGIITAGRRVFNGGIGFALTRHDANGNLDLGFGTAGIVTTDLGSTGDEAFDMAAHPDGGFVVVGRTNGNSLNRDFGVVRYKDDGKPDPGFDGDGIVTTDFAGQGDQAHSVAVQPDGKVVVAGLATSDDFAENLIVQPHGRIVVVGRDTSSTILDMAVVRYLGNGTRDTGFGAGRIITADFHGSGEVGQDVALQPDGKIVAAGHTANGLETEFALMRIDS